MFRQQSIMEGVGRAVSRSRPILFAAALGVGLGGCESLLEVENPNNVGQDDVQRPEAAAALVNGTLARTSLALSHVLYAHATISDEFDWRGSFNYVNQLDLGIIGDDSNQTTTNAFNNLTAARWFSDETVRLLEGFQADGTLSNPRLLGRAYLYSGIIYATVPDMFEDFTFSDRQEAGPPVGQQNMHELYDMAVERLDKAIASARTTGDSPTEVAALAMRARAHWARALWRKLNPAVNLADPLIDDAAANADAMAVLARVAPDWDFQLTFSGASQQSEVAFNANSRLEIAIANEYVRQDASGRLSCTPLNPRCPEDGITVLDPIDKVKDPALREAVLDFIGGNVYASLTLVSAPEMHLILAESALKRGALGEFAAHLNALRTLQDELTLYDPGIHAAIPPLAVLKHHRKVNLFNQTQRRLGDLYRFGERSPRWLETSTAVVSPGSVLLISRDERQSNCFLAGTC